MLAATLVFAFLLAVTTQAATPPAQLYDPLITQKILKIAQSEPNPPTYPQYTDRTAGSWKYFQPDTWTSGSQNSNINQWQY